MSQRVSLHLLSRRTVWATGRKSAAIECADTWATLHASSIRSLQSRWPAFGGLVVSSIAAGAIIMIAYNSQAGADAAGPLARTLGLGNGIVAGAVLGGLTGLILALGGRRLAIAFAGLLLGLFGGWLAWLLGRPYAWVIDVVLVSTFGPDGVGYTTLVGLLFILLVGRGVMQGATVVLGLLFRRLERPATAPERPAPGEASAGTQPDTTNP